MAKSNHRKKQDRAKVASRRAEQDRRRVKVARQRRTAQHYARLCNPSASPSEVADILAAEFPDRPLAAAMMRVRMGLGAAAEDLAETARLMLERAAPQPPGMGALAVAALAAHLTGDEDTERHYALDLVARADPARDPGQWLEAVDSATTRDHPGQACELIEPYLREHPDDAAAAKVYARALAQAHADAEQAGPERAALERFRDRSGADALDRALDEFTARTAWGAIVRTWIDGEQAMQDRDHWRDAERDVTDALLAEVMTLFPFTGSVTGEDGELKEADGSADGSALNTPLRAFAADPETPAELAALAVERDNYLRYGVWQVADPSPSPGVWCTDLVSGTRRYAQFPAEETDGAPPWSVWLGALAPSGGIWRSTRAGIWLSPIEGDAIAEYAEDAVWHMLHAVSGESGDYPPPPEQVRFGQAEPYCVRWETAEEPEPKFGEFASLVVMRLAPRLPDWVWMKRGERLQLRNTDQEPMVLIDATVAVDGDVTERLFARPDFSEERDGEDGEIVWWGAPVDHEPVVLHYHDDGSAHVMGGRADGEEERTVLGRLTPGPRQVRVRVNSEPRLERVLRILKEIGADPKVTEESRAQPSVDFAWGPVPADGVTARQRAENWLDQPVAALEFHTPRHAAEGGLENRLRLEGLLRQLEYQSALPAERGGRPVDTDWLRAELDLESAPPSYPLPITHHSPAGRKSPAGTWRSERAGWVELPRFACSVRGTRSGTVGCNGDGRDAGRHGGRGSQRTWRA